MKKEIISGLTNAISKGETLESAKQSFINAGYNLQEVEQAVSELSNALNISAQQNYFRSYEKSQKTQELSKAQEKNSFLKTIFSKKPQESTPIQKPIQIREPIQQRNQEKINLESLPKKQKNKLPLKIIILGIILIILLILLGISIFAGGRILDALLG